MEFGAVPPTICQEERHVLRKKNLFVSFTVAAVSLLVFLLFASPASPASAASPAPARSEQRIVIAPRAGQAASVLASSGPVKIRVSSVKVTEGNAGTALAIFEVSLSKPNMTSVVSLQFATADNTAKVADNDYQAQSVSLTFLPGAVGPATIAVPVNGDQKPERNESFYVKLSNPVGGIIARARGTGRIVDDDKVKVRVSSAKVVEGNAGTTMAIFYVSLSEANPGPGAISVHFNTLDHTATVANNDYQAQSIAITFLAGAIGPAAIVVPVIGDTAFERKEIFWVALSNPVGMKIVHGRGTGAIVNDDHH